MAAISQLGSVSSQQGHRVLVSYAAPQPILASQKWQQVQAAIEQQLPLRNVHWKPPSRTSLRTIQDLDVSLVPLDTIRDEHSQIPITLLEKPLMNIYLVVCSNNDAEGYRTTIKKQIKDWHSVITTKRNQEWLILHIVRLDVKAQNSTLFKFNSVFEKIKADFNTEKKERCIQVAWTSEDDPPTIWADFINKMKDGILAAFDQAVIQREEEIKRSESQRQMPGWNFCTFFVLKETLANSYEGVNLFEDAYVQYDELERSFSSVLNERNMSWFGTLIQPAEGDDSAPLLSILKKPYRQLIIANTISVFDFRIYIHARQCEILAKRGRFGEICRKSEVFLNAFGRRLGDVEGTLPPFFIESWTYSSALSVVEYCDHWSADFDINGPKLNTFNAAKGELLELARHQLDLIGIDAGHLPPKPPFSSSYHRPQPTNISKDNIGNKTIRTALESADEFYELYTHTTNRAIAMYTKSGRKKFALKLHGSLAALDLHRGRLDSSLATYSSLPAHYAPHMWTSLEYYMLSRALDTHETLEKPKDTEWIHILLSFLKAYVESDGAELLVHNDHKIEYVTKLANDLLETARKLDNEIVHPDHPAITIRVIPEAELAGDRDGCYINAIINNHLPCKISADGVTITLAGRDSELCVFSAPAQEFLSGETIVKMFCVATTAGAYILDSSEIRLSNLCLQWSHKQANKMLSSSRDKFSLVRIPKDLLALDVRLGQPSTVELGEPSTLHVELSTGRNDVAEASLRVTSSGVKFRFDQAYYSGDKQRTQPPEILDNSIILRDLPSDTMVSLMLPHSDTSAFQALKISTEVDYSTSSEPDVKRKFRTTRVVLTTLPIAVNVEDFFRGQRLFSKFTVSPTTHQHVRICSAELNTPEGGLDGVSIECCRPNNRESITVTPAQSANFLFCISSVHGPVCEPLYLTIKYRILREEVESLVENTVLTVAKQSPEFTQHHRVKAVNDLIEALESDASWVELYGITGQLKVPERSDEAGDDTLEHLTAQAREILADHTHPLASEGAWREIKIPVDIPFMNIVAAASIKILATPFSDVDSSNKPLPLYAGQPISAALTIQTSFHWGSTARDKDRRHMLHYDVEELVRDWLVSGPKCGDLEAEDGGTYTIPVTLIALHHGELALPKVAITPLPVTGEMTMGSMAVPSIETYQIHGAETVMVLPRGGRSTFVIGMGST